jgi:hypothetical protein
MYSAQSVGKCLINSCKKKGANPLTHLNSSIKAKTARKSKTITDYKMKVRCRLVTIWSVGYWMCILGPDQEPIPNFYSS